MSFAMFTWEILMLLALDYIEDTIDLGVSRQRKWRRSLIVTKVRGEN